MKLAHADKIADMLDRKINAIFPPPTRVLIAGSIRRRKPEPGDIDIVIEATDACWEAIRWWIDMAGYQQISAGNDLCRFNYPAPRSEAQQAGPVQVDLSRALPATVDPGVHVCVKQACDKRQGNSDGGGA